jgi:hypothetical protein
MKGKRRKEWEMRVLIYLSFIVAAGIGYLSCKDAFKPETEDKPETVLSVKYVWKSNDWYKKQIGLWQEEIEKNPESAEAWYNFYKANRYYRFEDLKAPEKHKLLEDIVARMGANVPESYEYNLLKATHTPNSKQGERTRFIFKAYEIDPERPETYYLLVDYYDQQNDLKKRREFYRKLYQSRDLAQGLLEYNYNVLMSLDANAILITHGDNDTYPALLLQDVFQIRDDVTVLNISLSRYVQGHLENYLARRDIDVDFSSLPEKKEDIFLETFVQYLHEYHRDIPVYLALTVYDGILKPFEGKLHIIGLAYRYHTEEFDNLAKIKKNLEQDYRLDYLSHDWYAGHYPGTENMPGLNMNYTVPMLMLAKHYKESGDPQQADRWKEMALQTGDHAGELPLIEAYIRER